MLEIRDLSARAGRFRLSGISLSVEKGRFHVIMGPTGAGKTLLLECIAGLRTPCTGQLLLDGEDLSTLPVEKRNIGLVPQDLALFPHLTVKENILYGLRRRGGQTERGSRRVTELCEALSIGHLLHRDVRTLSGGEKQMVALARALALECGLLLLDEPFTGLHRGMRKDLWFMLKGLQRQLGVTVLMVAHDLEEALLLGDTMRVMIDGSIRQTGTSKELYERPNSVEVAQSIGIRNFFQGRIWRVESRELHVRSQELNGTFVAVRPPHWTSEVMEDTPVRLGIRAEEVAILYGGDLDIDSENTISGTVKAIFDKGGSRILLFEPSGSRSQIEIEEQGEKGDLRQLEVGQQVRVWLRRESFLCFPMSRELEQLALSSSVEDRAGTDPREKRRPSKLKGLGHFSRGQV